jgi:hypothetical protein
MLNSALNMSRPIANKFRVVRKTFGTAGLMVLTKKGFRRGRNFGFDF